MPSRSERALSAAAIAIALTSAAPARAETEEPKVDFMHVLAARGLHDLDDELVNAYGQISLIGQGKAPFSARYTNLGGTWKSLLPNAEGTWTATATLFLGAKLWRGAEAYIVPEIISARPLSNLNGLGGAIQNGELQKTGGAVPSPYMSRVYLRQTFNLGGEPVEQKSGAMSLGSKVDSRRIVLTLGKFSTIDFLDKNAFAGDVRRQFVGLGFMTHAAWDFATDARGYTWGGVIEAYFDDWALRFAHTMVPLHPNALEMDFRFWKYFGDQLELEHVHKILGQRGSVKLLGYRNHENMGRFADAVAAFRADPAKNARNCASANLFYYELPPDFPSTWKLNASAPDLCWVRKPNVKLGIGVNLEQAIGDDLGVFFRGMYSDGQTEVYAYMPADRSISFGALARGTWWKRPNDSVGVASGVSWISKEHAAYLNAGGIDGFIGDGKIDHAAEATFEVFYSLRLIPPLWITADYQHVIHPASNADRGPVDIAGGRLHAEF
jgi:hypothetical protein